MSVTLSVTLSAALSAVTLFRARLGPLGGRLCRTASQLIVVAFVLALASKERREEEGRG